MTVTRSDIGTYRSSLLAEATIRQWVLAAALIATVLLPNITVSESFYKPRAEDLILAGIAVISFFELTLKRRKLATGASGWNIKLTHIMLGMLYGAALSIGIGAIVFQQPLVFNDFMVVPMIVRHWLVLQVGQWVVNTGEKRAYFWALFASLGLSALVGVLQYFNLLGVNSWLTPLYSMENQTYTAVYLMRRGIGGIRVIGTHGDPRHYGYILVVGIAFCIASLVYLRDRVFRVISVILLILCFVSVVFTASRTAFLSSVVVILASVLLIRRGHDRIVMFFGLLIILAALAVLVFPQLESTTFEQRVLDVETASFDRSLRARIRDFARPFEFAFENPVIWLTGRGPSKATVRTDSHNDLGWYFYRFGLPGLVLYILLIVCGNKLGISARKTALDPIAQVIGTTATLLSLNWFIYAMAENIFKQPQLMALNMFVYGAAIGITRMERDDSGETG